MCRTPGWGEEGRLNRELPSLPSRDHPLPLAWQTGEFSLLGQSSQPLGRFFFLLWKGRKQTQFPPLHVGSTWQAPAASVTNSIDNGVLVQRLRLMFVNFSIFCFLRKARLICRHKGGETRSGLSQQLKAIRANLWCCVLVKR